MIDRIHHFAYAAALVACVAIVAYFFAPVRTIEPVPGNVATQSALDKVAASVNAVQQHVDALAAVRANAVPIVVQPAVNAVTAAAPGVNRYLTGAEIAQILSGLGRRNLVPTYHLATIAPTPKPTASALPAGMTSDLATFQYTMTYNATAQALKDTKLNFTVTQEPAPPSRIKSVYGLDKSAGIAYALRRRGDFDLDVGATQGEYGTQPFVGVETRLRGTSVGGLLGVTERRGKIGAFVAVPVSLP